MNLRVTKLERSSNLPGRLQARAELLAVLALLAISFGCSGDSAKAKVPGGPPPAMPVKVEVAALKPVRDSSEYVATLKSRDSANISPQVEGSITHIFVHSGESVNAGAPLMQIDPIKQEATVSNQEAARAAQAANLKYVQQQYDRNTQLAAQGVISRQALDESRAALDAAKAQLEALQAGVREQQAQLHYYRVVAPMSGIVGDIPVRVGDRVTTSTLLTTVDKPGNLEAYVQVPVERAPDLKLGKEVNILDGAGNVMARGKITFVSPEVDTQTQTVLTKALIDNDKGLLRTAQFVRARLIWNAHPGLEVPVLALSRINGQFFVYVAEGEGKSEVAHQRQLKLGDMDGNNYVVLDGLKPGDKIIVSGNQMLADGVPVSSQTGS